MPLSGYTSNLPNELLNNPALVKVGSAVLGVTKGGVNWDPEATIEEIVFDGLRVKGKGLSRIQKYGGKLSFTLLQLATAAELQQILPGATTATGGTGISSVITPKSAGILFASGDYLTDLRAIWELSTGNTYIALHLACAYCDKWTIKGGDVGEAEIAAEFTCAVDLSTGTTHDAPYNIELRSALP